MFNLSVMPQALAHLMVAQHGTLNFVGQSAFMVLSLPISAFKNIDDDGNGAISLTEFNLHRKAIEKSVREQISLQPAQSRGGGAPKHTAVSGNTA